MRIMRRPYVYQGKLHESSSTEADSTIASGGHVLTRTLMATPKPEKMEEERFCIMNITCMHAVESAPSLGDNRVSAVPPAA